MTRAIVGHMLEVWNGELVVLLEYDGEGTRVIQHIHESGQIYDKHSGRSLDHIRDYWAQGNRDIAREAYRNLKK